MNFLKNNQGGQGLTEYSLILALLLLAIVAIFSFITPEIGATTTGVPIELPITTPILTTMLAVASILFLIGFIGLAMKFHQYNIDEKKKESSKNE